MTKPKKPKRAKTVMAWALMENGKLAIYDHRLPIFWLKYVAKREGDHHCIDWRIARVEIREIK